MLCIGGRKSRNKVIVGEPAIGSLTLINRYCSTIKFFLNMEILYGGSFGLIDEEDWNLKQFS